MTSEPLGERRIGCSDITISELGFGAGPIGGRDRRVSDADVHGAIETAWQGGIRYFDTAPWYGRGLSEQRLGRELRAVPRRTYRISTKVGRYLTPAKASAFDPTPWLGGAANDVVYDYSYDGIMRSVDQSRMRLGIVKFDLLFVHDLDHLTFDQGQFEQHWADLRRSGWRALEELRESGQVGAIGAGINTLGLIPAYLELADIDAFLVAMPYTLLDQDALDVDFPLCAERKASIVIGAVFASGILASGAAFEGAQYRYSAAPSTVRERVAAMEAVCRLHGVPLAAAALQFPLAHPTVAGILAGTTSADQQRQVLQAFHQPIAREFWDELKHEGLIRRDSPTP